MSLPERQVEELIYQSCLALDSEEYGSYLSLFSDDMRYFVTTYSPELRKEMVWLDHDKTGMKDLFKVLPQHVKLNGTFHRQASVYTTVKEGNIWNIVTALTLTYTDINGHSTLMAVGKYLDKVTMDPDQPLIVEREVRLSTRDLGTGIHVPI